MKHPVIKAKVSITEVAPDADQLIESLKEPARLQAHVQQLIKQSKRRLERKRKRQSDIQWRNQNRRQKAEKMRRKVLEVAAQVVRENPELKLPRMKGELVKHIRIRLPKPPSDRTIHRYLER